jgi:hypothetical protein
MKRRTAQDRKLLDDARLLRAWRKWHRDERDAVLAGPHAAVLGELFRVVENLQHVRSAQLIGFVKAVDWASIDAATKQTVMHEIDTAIIKQRERAGLAPIDDPLPGAPPNAFQVIHGILTSFPPDGGKACRSRSGK